MVQYVVKVSKKANVITLSMSWTVFTGSKFNCWVLALISVWVLGWIVAFDCKFVEVK